MLQESQNTRSYRGRLAPSPTGLLHIGHARTFWIAQQRAVAAGGILVLRNEDLDASRAKPQFVSAMIEDMQWFGLRWQEGPDCGGNFGPYSQSQRLSHYKAAFEKLRNDGWIYPCNCSRQDVLKTLQAPHAGEEEPIYPGTCRNRNLTGRARLLPSRCYTRLGRSLALPVKDVPPVNWRFRIPENETIEFVDGFFGPQKFVAGKDFGDFVVWRQDGAPSYQLAVVVDDAAMKTTEVVRGADLLLSTARQLLLYRALNLPVPAFYHCPLVTDASGLRLAKRHDALSLRACREKGFSPEELRERMEKNEM